MMEQTAVETIRRHNMLQRGNHVIVGLSGGADSVALFHFLQGHAAQFGVSVAAAHLNHGLRGQEADRDTAFVEEMCASKGIKLYTQNAQMNRRPKPQGVGVEEWARKLRYAFFEELAAGRNAKIALAHTLSDNAETILFRLARGTGPRGLGGIPPVRGPFIRPLIGVSRQQIEAYCNENGLSYVTDSTNKNPVFARNRIRRYVLPQLEQAHSGATVALGRLAGDMRELTAYLDSQAATLLRRAKTQNGYKAEVLLAAPGPVRLQALASLGGANVSRAVLGDMEKILHRGTGVVMLPKGKVVKMENTCLVVGHAGAAPAITGPYAHALRPGQYQLPGGYILQVQLLTRAQFDEFETKTLKKGLTFVADYDKIAKNTQIRNRRQGDLFSQKGRGVTKTLKKWMNEQKILPETRDVLPLLAQEEKILWVWGHGFCEGVQVCPQTERVLLLVANKNSG